MAKSSVQCVCSECGWNGPKRYGRCPECGQWGTVEEFHEARPAAGSRTAAPGRTSRTQSVTVADNASTCSPSDYRSGHGKRRAARYRVFRHSTVCSGGGVVPGSVTLIAGEPGIGKSTLLLQTAGNIARVVAGDSTFRGAGQRSAQQSGRAQGNASNTVPMRGNASSNTRQHRAVHFRRGITGAGSFARFPHQCGGAELVTGLHHRPVHSIGADRTEQAGLGHCGFGADHRLAGGRWHFRRFDSGARSGKRADRYR